MNEHFHISAWHVDLKVMWKSAFIWWTVADVSCADAAQICPLVKCVNTGDATDSNVRK